MFLLPANFSLEIFVPMVDLGLIHVAKQDSGRGFASRITISDGDSIQE
jgi:hypothetical protein